MIILIKTPAHRRFRWGLNYSEAVWITHNGHIQSHEGDLVGDDGRCALGIRVCAIGEACRAEKVGFFALGLIRINKSNEHYFPQPLHSSSYHLSTTSQTYSLLSFRGRGGFCP